MKKYILFLLVLIISCNKEYPIKPKFKEAGDWNTDIQLVANNYNRIEILLETSPPKNIQRDIANLYIESRSNGDEFSPVDTIQNLYGFWDISYMTSPKFKKGQTYDVRLHWDFIEGEDLFSNVITFSAKNFSGEILKEIELPFAPTYWNLNFTNDEIIYYTNEYKITFNTNTKIHQLEDLPEILKNQNRLFNYKDLFISYNYYSRNILNFYYFNDELSVLDSSSNKSFYECLNSYNYSELQDIIVHQENLYLLMKLDNTNFQFINFDPYSRKIIKTYPAFNPIELFKTNYIYFCSDGQNFWIAKLLDWFNNSILKFDIETNTILSDDFTIPVFAANGLAWDGVNFWTQNWSNNHFIKFKTEDR